VRIRTIIVSAILPALWVAELLLTRPSNSMRGRVLHESVPDQSKVQNGIVANKAAIGRYITLYV